MSFSTDPRVPNVDEWFRFHMHPATDEEKYVENMRRRWGLKVLNQAAWPREHLWLKSILRKLVKYQFNPVKFDKTWWEVNTGTDLNGSPLSWNSVNFIPSVLRAAVLRLSYL